MRIASTVVPWDSSFRHVSCSVVAIGVHIAFCWVVVDSFTFWFFKRFLSIFLLLLHSSLQFILFNSSFPFFFCFFNFFFTFFLGVCFAGISSFFFIYILLHFINFFTSFLCIRFFLIMMFMFFFLFFFFFRFFFFIFFFIFFFFFRFFFFLLFTFFLSFFFLWFFSVSYLNCINNTVASLFLMHKIAN